MTAKNDIIKIMFRKKVRKEVHQDTKFNHMTQHIHSKKNTDSVFANSMDEIVYNFHQLNKRFIYYKEI